MLNFRGTASSLHYTGLFIPDSQHREIRFFS